MAIANSDGSVVLTTKIDVSGVSKAIDELKSKIDSVKEKKAAIQQLTQAIKDQQYVIKQLQIEYALLVAKGQGNTAQAGELRERIKALTAELGQLSGAATAMGVKTAAASTKAAQGIKKFGKRIAGIVKSALIFSVLYRVMQAVVKLFGNILMADEEFRQDWEELKAAFYTAAYPIINLIVPAIKFIVQQVRNWAVSIGKVAAALQGMTYSEFVEQAKASKEAADNYEKMAKDSKKTADNVKKQLAAFDDIQILSSDKDEEQGATLTGFEALKEYDTSGEKNMLADLMTAIGGALVALGLILIFNGIFGWGVGFVIGGASAFAVGQVATSEYDYTGILQMLTTITGFAGGALLALGIILLWVGGIVGIGVAIGMIIAGGALIVSAVAAQAAFAPDDIAAWLSLILGIAGGALLALGIILCMAGSIPLGVGMIIAGAVSLVSAFALNSEAVVEAIRGPLGVIMAIVGAALLVIGIILVCTGVGIPIGIALIAAGAIALVTPIALNWDAIVGWIRGAWDAVVGFWNKYIAPIFTAKFWLDLAKTCGNGLIAGFEGAINGLIWLFECLINFVVFGLNSFTEGISTVTGAIGDLIGVNLRIPKIPEASLGRVSIPRLAQGAVIPPNREFLAVLGDQKHGTNIETPLATMVEAFQMALDSRGGYSGGNTEVVLEIDGREFGRAVVEQGNRENRRIGTRLVIA